MERQLAADLVFVESKEDIAGLVLAGYRRYGERVWDLLRGDFACAIWHPPSQFAVMARDVIGARALYWAQESGRLLFSSEFRALVGMLSGSLKFDAEQISRYLSPVAFGAIELDRTLYSGIRRLAPGSTCISQKSGVIAHRFWDPRRIPRIKVKDTREAGDLLHERILSALQSCANTTMPVGCHVSGGLDCSTLAAMLFRNRPPEMGRSHYFSWTPRDLVPESSTELVRIDALVESYGFEVEYVDPESLRALEEAPDPILKSPFYPTETMVMEQHVLRSARRLGIRRMLSGWGGDEAASHHGFGIRLELLFRGQWLRLLRLLACRDQKWDRSRLGSNLRNLFIDLKRALHQHLPLDSKEGISAKYIRDRCAFRRSVEPDGSLSVREAQICAYFSGHLTERIESWYCHGKRFGVDYAYPLLHRDVLETVYGLPGWCFADETATRAAFRQVASRYWPGGVANSVRKDESGLAGFLTGGRVFQESVRQRKVGCAALAALSLNGAFSKIVDHQRLKALASEVSKGSSVVDFIVLSRADELARAAELIDSGDARN